MRTAYIRTGIALKASKSSSYCLWQNFDYNAGSKVGDAKPDLSSLGELAAGIGLHEHRCVIYDTKEQQLAAAVPFLRSGLERGEKCLYMVDESGGAAVMDALRQAGTGVDHFLRTGALVLANKREAHLQSGRFDPDLFIQFLSQQTRNAGDDGFPGLRTILGEMTWLLDEGASPESLIEFEAKANYFVRDHEVRGLCQYHRPRFSPEVLVGIIRTHPTVVYGNVICQNPYYVPPEELLKPNQAALELDRLLSNILKWQVSQNQLRALAARLETVREEERTRVAREVHDELGQALTAIKIEVAAVLRDHPRDQASLERSHSILILIDQTIESVRRIATELRPAILDIGPVAAIEWAAEEFQNRTGIKCELTLPNEEITLDPERATALFRIFQETLTNVARHADATLVRVRMGRENAKLVLEVSDNGKGITDEHLRAATSLGILGMRERIVLLGGTLEIGGAPEKGTTVRVLIPDPRQVGE